MLENIGVPAIEKAVQAIYKMNADERTKEEIRMREKAMHDQASMLLSAREEGREEGIGIGREEGRADLLAEMIADGVPESIIKKYLKNRSV